MRSRSPFEGTGTWLTYGDLGGEPAKVTPSLIAAEVALWPLESLVACLSALNLELLRAGANAKTAKWQGPYLNRALVDDFPVALPLASKLYSPGRAPPVRTPVLVHLQGLLWLTDLVLRQADANRRGAVDEYTWIRVCRLLLLVNTLLERDDSADSLEMFERRHAFAVGWLRLSQFTTGSEFAEEGQRNLAREWRIYRELLPTSLPGLEDVFREALGFSVDRYFELLALQLLHASWGIERGAPVILRRSRVFEALEGGGGDARVFLESWVQTPADYRTAVRNLEDDTGMRVEERRYDFSALRSRPLIELDSDLLVCPAPALLFGKAVDEPYYRICDRRDDVARFQQAVADAATRYMEQVVGRLAVADSQGPWEHEIRPVVGRPEVEVADIYLQRGEIGIAIECKAMRPSLVFLAGGDGSRLLGPSAECRTKLSQGLPVTLREGRKADDGVLTRGTWQQSSALPDLLRFARTRFGREPTVIFPVHVHRADVFVDDMVGAYLADLIGRAGLYADPRWRQPRWLRVADLEALTILAEDGRLDLEGLLGSIRPDERWRRFDLLLFERFGTVPFDRRLARDSVTLLERVGKTFWPGREFTTSSARSK